MRSDVRKKLIRVARQGKTITYGELMKKFRIPRGHPVPGIGIGHVVGTISEHEYSNKRPLLSAIVVRTGSGTAICPAGFPGGGFFGLRGIPKQLRKTGCQLTNSQLNAKEQAYITSEQKKVWQYWRNH